MSKCLSLEDIVNDGCLDNAGGIKRALFFDHADVAVWPDEPSAENMTMESFAALVGDLVFKSGKKAVEIETIPDKSSFEITEIGEQCGKSHQEDLTIFTAGLTKKNLGFLGLTKNRKMGALVQDANANWFLMGDQFSGIFRNGGDGAKTGAARSDLASTGLKFSWYTNNPRMYEGDVEALLKPATV